MCALVVAVCRTVERVVLAGVALVHNVAADRKVRCSLGCHPCSMMIVMMIVMIVIVMMMMMIITQRYIAA